jgi:hypothetical protein
VCRLFLVFCENFISLFPGTPKSARAPFLPKPGNKIRDHNRHDDKLPDPRPFLDGMGPAAHIADNRSFSRRLFAAFRLAGSPAYREAIDISCRTAYRSLPSVWYSIRFSISVNSIRIPPDPIHQKKPQRYTVAKKWQQKSLTVKVLFTIRQLQPEYEMQCDPGSFFG